jgi:pimeloyl-ACP methyl ester carboxylesterase
VRFLGHSYGGSVITGLTGIAHLVYVAAFLPSEHESAATLGGPHLVDSIVRRRPDGHTELDPRGAAPVLYGDCPPDDAARAVALLRPQGPGHGRSIPDRAAWRTIPTTYVICTDDRAIDPAIQQRLATRFGTILSWATSHSPFCSRPELVVDLLTDLLRH